MGTWKFLFEAHVLSCHDDGTVKWFSSLKSLTLIGFGWNINEGESPTRVGNWIEAFNFSKLKSLILHCGNDTGNLLDAVCQMDTPLKLKKLELVQFDQGFTDEILQSFQGLESLYIMHGQEELPPDFRNSVGFRYGSLKRLVAHRKLPYPEKDRMDSWLDDTKTLFSQWYLSPDVDRIGLVKGPAFLVTFHHCHTLMNANLHLQQSYIKATMQLRYQPKWKVLHFRRSMNDFFLDPRQSIEQVIHEIHFHR